MELKPYDEYRESLNPFIFSIPKQWDEHRFCTIASSKSIQRNTNEELLSVYLNRGVIKYSETSQRQVHKPSEDMSKYQLVEPGDIVLNNQQAWRGSVGVSKFRGIVSPAYFVFTLDKRLNPKYANYLFRDKGVVDQFVIASKGVGSIQRNLFYPFLKNVTVCMPPIEEQDKIVKYLDSQIYKINKYIRAKKKQITLLKEQKQAIINQAVTKGLNTDVKMKPSGLSLVGEIPVEWTITRLSRIAKITLSGLDKKTYENQQVVKLCNYVDVYRNDFINSDIDFMIATASESEIKSLEIKNGDVIITKDSESWNDIGVPALVNESLENVYCAYHLSIIRNTSDEVSSEFLYYAFQAQYVAVQYKVSAKGVTRFSLGYQPVHDTVILLPPLEEQHTLAEHIELSTQSISKAINVIEKEIELITEYRTRLISDVVTGKVDVRNIETSEIKLDLMDEIIEEDTEFENDSVGDIEAE